MRGSDAALRQAIDTAVGRLLADGTIRDIYARYGIEHRFLVGGARKQRLLEVRPEGAEDARPEQHSGQQLPHDSRLADALHEFAEQTAA